MNTKNNLTAATIILIPSALPVKGMSEKYWGDVADPDGTDEYTDPEPGPDHLNASGSGSKHRIRTHRASNGRIFNFIGPV
jgi:hypothetical protein